MAALTESEAAALCVLLFAAAAITLGWVAGSIGLPIRPIQILALSLGLGVGPLLATRGSLAGPARPVRLIGLLSVFFAFAAYIAWLAWPAFLPLGEGPDLVHHLTLIHFIQRRHAFPSDPIFGAYLGEMRNYTPGSHILAALAGDWFRVDALRVVHPLIAVAIGVKAAVVYNLLLRLLPAGRSRVAIAVAGTLLLGLPHAYLLQPITWYGFYSQVMAETFAIAMLWAAVAWHQAPSRSLLAAAAALGVAIALCWPVFLPPPALALAFAIVSRRDRSWPERIGDGATAALPIAAVVVVHAVTHASGVSMLASGGSVLTPSIALFGWIFLGLAAAGIVLAIVRARETAPLLAFAAVCPVQILALAVLQRRLHATNVYLAFKTVHLFVYALALFAALGMDACARTAMAPLARRARWTTGIMALLPLVVLAGLTRTNLPRRPVTSPITPPVYQAGLWARSHLPTACVDYLTEQWLTGYWLHLDMLGNPRQSGRMQHETFEYRKTLGRWIEGDNLPYAIAGDLESLPLDVRGNLRVLQQFGEAAVVERADRAGRCTDTSAPIDDVAR